MGAGSKYFEYHASAAVDTGSRTRKGATKSDSKGEGGRGFVLWVRVGNSGCPCVFARLYAVIRRDWYFRAFPIFPAGGPIYFVFWGEAARLFPTPRSTLPKCSPCTARSSARPLAVDLWCVDAHPSE